MEIFQVVDYKTNMQYSSSDADETSMTLGHWHDPSWNGRLTGKVLGSNLIDSKGINWRPDGHSYDKAAPTHASETWYIQKRKKWLLHNNMLRILTSTLTFSFVNHKSLICESNVV